MIDWQPVELSLKVAVAALFFVFLLGTGIGRLMHETDFSGKSVLEGLFILPLVLPPVVVGYLLLLLLGKNGVLGTLIDKFFYGPIIFTAYAATLAAVVVAFPLMYQSAKAAFQGVDRELEDTARTLGAGEWRVFFTVTLPLAWPGLVAGIILSFARALGEFGATIMVAGNIPGKTTTIPLAIYFAAESGDMSTAGIYAALVCIANLGLVVWLNLWTRGRRRTDRRVAFWG